MIITEYDLLAHSLSLYIMKVICVAGSFLMTVTTSKGVAKAQSIGSEHNISTATASHRSTRQHDA